MAHTPGPWFVDGESGNTGESEAISSAGRVVAWSASTYDEDTDSDEVTDEDRDNARLIAAAPELLAALKLLRDPDGDGKWPCYCDDPYFEGGACENCVATAAITKAEGRGDDNEV